MKLLLNSSNAICVELWLTSHHDIGRDYHLRFQAFWSSARTPMGSLRFSYCNSHRPVRFIFDEYDQAVWPHTARGFFQLNREIDDILESLGLEV